MPIDVNHLLQHSVLDNHRKYRDLLTTFAGNTLHAVLTTDWHMPDHDPAALDLQYLVAEKWFARAEHKLVINLGDVWDFPTIGRHENNIPFYLLYPGVDDIGEYISTAMKAYEDAEVNWSHLTPNRTLITGNHDIRFIKFIFARAPQIAHWTLQQFIHQVNNTGVLWLGNGISKIVFRDTVHMQHGELARKGGGNSVRAQMESEGNAFETVIQGHCHRVGYTARTRADGSVTEGFEIGCTQNLQPLYSSRMMDWQQGMALMKIDMNSRAAPQIHNLLFRPKHYDTTYLTTVLDGEEIRLKLPAKHFEIQSLRRGIFR